MQRDRQPVEALVSPERFEQLTEALEDREDIAVANAAIAQGGESILLAPVMKDLALS